MDQKILFLINGEWTSPRMDLFMAAMSSYDLWFPLFALLGLGALIFGGVRARAALVSIAMLVAVGDGIVVGNIKKIVHRPRPHQVMADVRMVGLQNDKPRLLALFKPPTVRLSQIEPGNVSGRSFPSAHTVNNFCAAIVLAVFYRRWGWLYFLPASLVAYSRIYTGSHWPSDVVISIFLAAGMSLLVLSLLEWLWRRQAPRLVPSLCERHPSLFGTAPV